MENFLQEFTSPFADDALRCRFATNSDNVREIEQRLERKGIYRDNARLAYMTAVQVRYLSEVKLRELLNSPGYLYLPRGTMEEVMHHERDKRYVHEMAETERSLNKVKGDCLMLLYSLNNPLMDDNTRAQFQQKLLLKETELSCLCIRLGDLKALQMDHMLLVPLKIRPYYEEVLDLLERLRELYAERRSLCVEAQSPRAIPGTSEPSGPAPPPVPDHAQE